MRYVEVNISAAITNAPPTYPIEPTVMESVTVPPMIEPMAIPTLYIPLNMDIDMAEASTGDARIASFWNETLNNVVKNPQRMQTDIIVNA